MSPNPLDHPIAFRLPRRLSEVTAWQEHTPFAMYLVDLLQPNTIVELGTHFGDSYCAFCQAVAELRLATTCVAVDTWKGDEQAGLYGPEVLADLRAHHDPLYGGFSELLQSTFDEAVGRFEDRSIDLLHIDGCHRYEAVRHDFQLWRPKLSERGVVLLHDTVRRLDDFGVWRLEEELRNDYRVLEFTHGNGLAVVLIGETVPAALHELAALQEPELTAVRALFAALGAAARNTGELQRAQSAVALDERLRRIDDPLRRIEERLRNIDDPLLRIEERLDRVEHALEARTLLRLGRRVRAALRAMQARAGQRGGASDTASNSTE